MIYKIEMFSVYVWRFGCCWFVNTFWSYNR